MIMLKKGIISLIRFYQKYLSPLKWRTHCIYTPTCSEYAVQAISKYGIIKGKYIDENIHLIKDLVEKPDIESAPSNIAILGRYILKPDIFKILENQKPGKNNEIQLTDALKTLCESQAMYAYEFEGKRYDVGEKFGFLQATVEFALKNKELKDEFLNYLKELVKKY